MTFNYSSAVFGNLKDASKNQATEKLFFDIILLDSENQQLDSDASVFLKNEINKLGKPTQEQFKTIIRQTVKIYKVLDLGAILLFGNTMYAAVLGRVDIKIIRDQKLTSLCSGESDIIFLSGNLSTLDLVVMASKTFFEKFSDKLLIKFFSGGLNKGLAELGSLAKTDENYDIKAFFVQLVPLLPNPVAIKIARTNPLKIFSDLFNKLRFKLPQKIYVKSSSVSLEESQPKSRVSASVGIILTALLVVSILFGTIRKNQLQDLKKETEIVSIVEHQVSEAQAIFLLNPVRARELISEARTTLSSYKETKSTTINDLIKKVEYAEHAILGEYEKDPQLFFDLTLFSEGFRGGGLESSGNSLYIFDKGAKKIASIDTESKRSEIVAGPSLISDAVHIIPIASKILYLQKNGIYELEGKKLLEKTFDGEVLIAQYLGNLYVLDKVNSQILRFKGEGGTFTEGTWLSSDEKLDLTNSKDIVADGFLWILLNDGEIIKLSQGKKTKFSIRGVSLSNFRPTALYTNSDLIYLYLLDATNGKMVVINRDGEYKAQYYSEGLKGALDLVVYEKSKKAYFLTGEKLLYLDLEHL